MLDRLQIPLKGSRLTIWLTGFLIFFAFFKNQVWKKPEAIRHDMLSYYGYLPATFIHHDLTLSFVDPGNRDRYGWTTDAKNGLVFRMTMGVAIMEAPFFLVADSLTKLFALERTGYSAFYAFFALLGCVFYFLGGLVFVNRVVSGLFDPITARWTCLVLAFGTNLFYYTIDEGLMSHVFSFFLYSALLYYSLKWHQRPRWKNALRIGLCIGMLTLLRPIHACSFLLPLGIALSDRSKWQMVKAHISHLFLVILVSFTCLLPQLLYWHHVSGQWLYYSYMDEGFFFNDPQILRGLLGFRKGWLIYTPVMFLAIPGLFFLYKRHRSLFWPFLLFLPVYVYVIFSWWCWWYGGGYGSRPMIDIYGWMALPLAAFIFRMRENFPARWLVRSLLVFFIFLSIFQTHQYRRSLIHWDGMNAQLFGKIWLRSGFPEGYDKMVTPPDYQAAIKGQRDQ